MIKTSRAFPETTLLSGVVAGIQLDNCSQADVQRQIDEIRQVGAESSGAGNLLCGARHILALDANPASWLEREDVLQNMSVLENNNLAFDLLVTQHQHTYSNLATLLRRYPNMHFVLDHIAKPDMKFHKRWQEWQTLIDSLARLHPNVYCKISGLLTEADLITWTLQDIKPYVEYAINAFGVKRCMFASDWPVFKLARNGTYAQVFSSFLDAVPVNCRQSQYDMDNLLRCTAEQAYRI